jgi:hypothetical protein
MKNTRLIITSVEENVCTKHVFFHVCIAINDGCESKYIWTWMNVDKCEWMSTNDIHPQLLNSIHLFQYYMLLFNSQYY